MEILLQSRMNQYTTWTKGQITIHDKVKGRGTQNVIDVVQISHQRIKKNVERKMKFAANVNGKDITRDAAGEEITVEVEDHKQKEAPRQKGLMQ